jgi:hypothetical protein
MRFSPLGMVKVPPQLQMHPKIRRRAKVLRQSEGRAWGEAASPIDQLIHPLVGHVNLVGEVALRESHGLEEFLYQHLSWVRRFSMCGHANHGMQRLPISDNQLFPYVRDPAPSRQSRCGTAG